MSSAPLLVFICLHAVWGIADGNHCLKPPRAGLLQPRRDLNSTSCRLSARVASSGRELLLSFGDGQGVEMGIGIGGVVERGAGIVWGLCGKISSTK